MRRGSALGVTAAATAALVGAWRLGEVRGPTTTASGLATPAPSAAAPQSTSTNPSTSSSSSSSTSRATQRQRTASASPSSTHVSSPRSFDGAAEQTQFGTVQVRAVVQGGKLVDVQALRLTDSGGRSVQISAYSAPILRREALAAGSARINAVSGASYTSAGYIQSLQSALDAARAAGA